MARVVLLLPTGTYRAGDFIDAAHSVGAEVIVASDRRQALAEAMGDRSVVLDFSAPDASAQAIVDLAGRGGVDGIVAVDDQGVLVGAIAASRLGLPHNAVDAVAATRDKAEMRMRLARAAGVAQPRFKVVDDAGDVASAVEEVGLPVVVKPVSLSASRGVIRADSMDGAVAAADRVRRILDCADEPVGRQLLVEQYVPGDEVAVEGLLRGGELEVLAIFDKPDPLEGPYFEETIYVTPSRHPAKVVAAIEAATAEAARALGLTEGPVHAEHRIDGERVVVLELAARSIGGLCSRSLRFGAGVSLEELIVRHALDLPLTDMAREDRAAGVMMLPIPTGGILRGVDGQDAARAVLGVVGLEITLPPGRTVVPLPEGDRYLGFLFAAGGTPAEVERSLRDAHSHLEVRIEPAG